jgi:hypothetical protein
MEVPMFARICFALLAVSAVAAAEAPRRAVDHVVIGGERIPFGVDVEIDGPCVDNDDYGMAYSGFRIKANHINGKPTSQSFEFVIYPGDQKDAPTRETIKKIEIGDYYRARGRLTDACFTPSANSCLIVVSRLESIEPKPLTFADFIDQPASLEGEAVQGGRFRIGDQVAKIGDLQTWPPKTDGKKICVLGIIRQSADGWRVEKPEWSFVELEDLLNQDVFLEGALLSLNDHWWFSYRETRIYLCHRDGPILDFDSDSWRQTVRVRGRLVRQNRPSLKQISLKSARDLIPTFVIRGAEVEYLDPDKKRDPFPQLYPTYLTVADGVPELLEETSIRRNLLGNESFARLYLERNRIEIDEILRTATPNVCDVLARRMNAVEVAVPLRLLYGAMLARLNDERGQRYLASSVNATGSEIDIDAVYCLGVFPFLAQQTNPTRVDVAWAEQLVIDLVTNKQSATFVGKPYQEPFQIDGPWTVAEVVTRYSHVFDLLRLGKSEASRKTLLTLARAEPVRIDLALAVQPPLSIDELMEFEPLATESWQRRQLLARVLRQNESRFVVPFLKDLGESFVYMDIRDRLTRETADVLRAEVEKLEGEARVHVRLLLILAEKDPVPTLLELLQDKNWSEKNLVLFELSRLADPRAVKAVAHCLRTWPANTLDPKTSLASSAAVEHALKAIARTGTTEAIRELISLFNTDPARFGSSMKRNELNLHVAEHLIELTGESFGLDAEGWQRWLEAHPDHFVPHELAYKRDHFRTNAGEQIDPKQINGRSFRRVLAGIKLAD